MGFKSEFAEMTGDITPHDEWVARGPRRSPIERAFTAWFGPKPAEPERDVYAWHSVEDLIEGRRS